MSTGFVGTSVKRLEDEALLTGQGRYIDDLRMPGLLEAAFVRSPHPHARIVSIDTTAACELPGVRAVLHPGGPGRGPHLQRHPVRPSHLGLSRDVAAAGDGGRRGVLRGRARRRRHRRFALHGGGRGSAGGRRVRTAPVGLRLPGRARPRRAHRASRRERQHRQGNTHRVRRLRRRVRRRGPRLRRLAQAAPRGRALHRAARRHRATRGRDGPGHGVDLDPGAAPHPKPARGAAGHRRAPGAGHRSGRGRRVRRQEHPLRRRGVDRRRRASPRRARQVDRGSTRAFPRRDPGTRPVLGHGGRHRQRGAPARGAGPGRPRSGGPDPACAARAAQLLHRGAGSLRAAELPNRRHRGRDEQGGNHPGARRRLPRGRVRDGAPARRGGARARTGPRGDSPPQSRAGGSHPLRAAHEDTRGHADHLRERRLPRGAAAGDGGGGPRRLPDTAGARPGPRAGTSGSASRT